MRGLRLPVLGTGLRGAARRWYDDWSLRRDIRAHDVADISDTVDRATQFAWNLHRPERGVGRFVYGPAGDESLLYASVFAALLLSLVGELEDLDEEAKFLWSSYIKSHQDPDGLFRDPLIDNELARTADWWGWRHLTFHAVQALHALGSRPCHSFAFIRPILDPSAMHDWLSGLDWGAEVSFTSNAVQNVGALLQYSRDFLDMDECREPLHALMATVQGKGDPRTGLWGNDYMSLEQALSEGVQAGYHFWLLFCYDRREVPNTTEAIDSVLRLQNDLGGFNLQRRFSSACEDIDALDPLVRLTIGNRDLEERCRAAIERAVGWTLYNFNDDGGAVFRRGSAFEYGHPRMSSAKGESSIFATWFRVLSLAVASVALDRRGVGFDPLFLECPGLQFSPDR